MQLRAILAATSLSAAGVLAFAAPANASIGSCDYTFPSSASASTYCTGSAPSAFRTKIQCTNGGYSYGPWRFAGDGVRSIATCPSGQDREAAWIETAA